MANENNQLDARKTAEMQFIQYKNQITNSVMKRIASLEAAGGITVPKNYSSGNQINLAMLRLTNMKDKQGNLVLSKCTSASVANALLNMCIQGLSLEKNQCYFIPYGNELQFQPSYLGRIALAKRVGGAGEPQAQVIYEGDVFEYVINPRTGKKEIVKHEQNLANIDNDKIIGAWCIIPYAEHPEWEPKVEVMTIREIKTSWLQGATKGQSGAHKNFTQEMVKKTIISRACKQFLSTSDDAGIFGDDRVESADYQPQEEMVKPNANEAVFEALPQTPSAEVVESVGDVGDMPEMEENEAKPAEVVAEPSGDGTFGADFFNA